MGNTKKVSTTGRFGARYGVSVKKRVLKVEAKQHEKHTCQFCGFKKIKRKSRGIFECRKCGKNFAGGAFLPSTLAGGIIKKMVAQKSFLPLVGELTAAQEASEKILEEIKEENKKEHSTKANKEKDGEEDV